MPRFCRLAAIAVAATVVVPAAAYAMDDFIAAESSAPTEIKLCGDTDSEPIKTAMCREAGYDKLVTQIDAAFTSALAGIPANVRPLFKRDQAWFNEIIVSAAESIQQFGEQEDREAFADRLRQRITTLEQIAEGHTRPGLTGKWADAFGSVTVTPAENGAYRLAIDARAVYGVGSDRRRECKAQALLKPASGGWLTGTVLSAGGKQPAASGENDASDARPATPPSIRIRRQGETLRVVISDGEWEHGDPDCTYLWQVTGNYFANGKPDASAPADKIGVTFVAPTFDCARPATASDEEICADPDLAENDQRLNRAWRALLPRLDDVTRRALTEDQRNWVKSQAYQYPEFLHPAWEKTTSFMHFTTDARDKLERLQRERIALLEGFDENRKGLAGLWLSHTAVLRVTPTADGGLKAEGWKWDQGDWKAGCDFDMTGNVVGGVFRSDEKRTNPDTLERDHATLVVNRLDDVFAKKREGKTDTGDDEPKCKRNITISSAVRLFPARPSPDIDNLGGSIR